MLNVIDGFTRECLAIQVDGRLKLLAASGARQRTKPRIRVVLKIDAQGTTIAYATPRAF